MLYPISPNGENSPLGIKQCTRCRVANTPETKQLQGFYTLETGLKARLRLKHCPTAATPRIGRQMGIGK